MGWNGSDSNVDLKANDKHQNKRNGAVNNKGLSRSIKRGLFVGVIVVVCGGLASWIFCKNQSEENSKVGDVNTHSILPTVAPAVTNITKPQVVVTEPKMSKPKMIPRRSDGRVDWTKIKPHELPKEMIASDPEPTDAPHPVFSNSADQVIAMLISTPPDLELPPIVGLGDDLEIQFFKSLEKPVKVEENDTPEMKALKENLLATKKQIMEMIDQGKTVSQILQAHREVFNENRKDYAENQAMVNQLFEDGDIEGAKTYVEKANPVLEQFGAPLLKMPKTREERLAEKRALRESRLRGEKVQ